MQGKKNIHKSIWNTTKGRRIIIMIIITKASKRNRNRWVVGRTYNGWDGDALGHGGIGWGGVLQVIIHGMDEVVCHGCCPLQVGAHLSQVSKSVGCLYSLPHLSITPAHSHLWGGWLCWCLCVCGAKWQVILWWLKVTTPQSLHKCIW